MTAIVTEPKYQLVLISSTFNGASKAIELLLDLDTNSVHPVMRPVDPDTYGYEPGQVGRYRVGGSPEHGGWAVAESLLGHHDAELGLRSPSEDCGWTWLEPVSAAGPTPSVTERLGCATWLLREGDSIAQVLAAA